MNFVSVFMVFFSVLGALDRIIGNRFGLGKQFEKGFMLLGNMALSMMGMIIISPYIAQLLQPVFGAVYNVFHIDPSIIPASLFANDMGDASLAAQTAVNNKVGMFNALVVSSMMGCTISFTIPYALNAVDEQHHKQVLFGFLCGIVTIPIGCFAAGLIARLPVLTLLLNLLPLILFSAALAAGLVFCPNVCVKIFSVLGTVIKIIITIGLSLGVIKFLTGIEIIAGLESYENAGLICLNAAAVMTGAFPFLHIISKLVSKPMSKLGEKWGINETSALGFVSSVATSMTTFEMMNKMDKRGIVLNSAFAVSAAFTFAGHLAFTMAFEGGTAYILPMIAGKLIAGVLAVVLAFILYKDKKDA